jgi:ribosomal protein L11 methylase PrmA
MKQNDVDTLPAEINIDAVGPSGNFVNFIKYKSETPSHPDIIFQRDFTQFTCKALICDKLDNHDKLLSLERMIKNLETHIEHEIKKEMEKLKWEKEIKGKLHELKIKASSMRGSLEAYQASSNSSE